MTTFDIEVDNKKRTLYMDTKLHTQLLTKVRPGVQKKDKDYCLIVDGSEGSGKSVFSFQLAKVLHPDFSLNNVAMTPEEFTKAVLRAKKGECIVFDEAFTGLSSRSSLAEVNKVIVSLMMEMRQKNLFVIIVMPTIFLLDKYVALWRARGLFHVYTTKGKRGRWVYFNNKKKKLLYLLGKKLYDYSKPRTKFRGRFYDQYTVNEQEYRFKKELALKKKSRTTRAETYLRQRNILIYILYKDLNVTQDRIAKLCKKHNFRLERSWISRILKDIEIEKAEQDNKA